MPRISQIHAEFCSQSICEQEYVQISEICGKECQVIKRVSFKISNVINLLQF